MGTRATLVEPCCIVLVPTCHTQHVLSLLNTQAGMYGYGSPDGRGAMPQAPNPDALAQLMAIIEPEWVGRIRTVGGCETPCMCSGKGWYAWLSNTGVGVVI